MKRPTPHGATIRVRLRALGMTQKQLAAAADISEGWLSQYITGLAILPVEVVQRIARALDIAYPVILPASRRAPKRVASPGLGGVHLW